MTVISIKTPADDDDETLPPIATLAVVLAETLAIRDNRRAAEMPDDLRGVFTELALDATRDLVRELNVLLRKLGVRITVTDTGNVDRVLAYLNERCQPELRGMGVKQAAEAGISLQDWASANGADI